jgi:hypothetical protein
VFEITTRVIGIVILKRKIPKIHNKGFSAQNESKKAETAKEIIQTFSKPNLSAKIQPNDFQKITQRVKIKPSKNHIFQGNTTIKPMKERISIENKMKKQIIKTKLSFFVLDFSISKFGSFVKKIEIIEKTARTTG